MAYRIGIDVGGTFTDCAAVNKQLELQTGKVPTRQDEAESVLDGLSVLAQGFGLDREQFLKDSEVIRVGHNGGDQHHA